MAVQTFSLRSSWLSSADYNDQTRELVVHTDRGGSYSFSLVPPEIVESFAGSPSPGRFFHSVLKGY
jgi:hypothetical protein